MHWLACKYGNVWFLVVGILVSSSQGVKVLITILHVKPAEHRRRCRDVCFIVNMSTSTCSVLTKNKIFSTNVRISSASLTKLYRIFWSLWHKKSENFFLFLALSRDGKMHNNNITSSICSTVILFSYTKYWNAAWPRNGLRKLVCEERERYLGLIMSKYPRKRLTWKMEEFLFLFWS